MQSADDVKLRDCLGITGSRGLECFFEGHGVGAGRIFLAPKCTQAAGCHANVGRIQVAVDVEVRLVTVHAFANVVGEPADRQNVASAIEGESIFELNRSPAITLA